MCGLLGVRRQAYYKMALANGKAYDLTKLI